MNPILLIVILILALLLLPVYPYSRNWGTGYYPSGVFLIVLIILLILYLR